MSLDLAVTGFECEFVEKPPEVLQSSCPICLLILREPYQVTCCGNSFCRACIQKIKTKSKPCPTCNQENFTDYSNLGLQRPLYGYKVYCSNKDEGCDWQGELGQLDKHLNLNPNQDKQEIGCVYTRVKCSHCSELYQRHLIKCHQTSECLLRPFSCEMCKVFKSTYDDVVKNHAPSCKCRPVECPNTCGNTIQHQELGEHLSSVCPLSMVECEFSHAGCDVKMHRKDLPSHLSESMVTHMSLLARENKRQSLKIESQDSEIKRQSLQIERQSLTIDSQDSEIKRQCSLITFLVRGNKSELQKISCVPPIDFKLREGESSQPFYSHIGGYKLQLTIEKRLFSYNLVITMLESEFEVKSPYNLSITVLIIDQVDNKDHKTCNVKLSYPSKTASEVVIQAILLRFVLRSSQYIKDGYTMIRITAIAME